MSPLLMEHGDAMVAAIGNHIPNPPAHYGAGPTTTFPARYYPIRDRAIGWQPHWPECWFIGNELN